MRGLEENRAVGFPPARCRRGEADWFGDVDGGLVGVKGGAHFEVGCVVGLEGGLVALPGEFDDVVPAFAVVYPAALAEADDLIRLGVLVQPVVHNAPRVGCVVVHDGDGIDTGVRGLGIHGLLCLKI